MQDVRELISNVHAVPWEHERHGCASGLLKKCQHRAMKTDGEACSWMHADLRAGMGNTNILTYEEVELKHLFVFLIHFAVFPLSVQSVS